MSKNQVSQVDIAFRQILFFAKLFTKQWGNPRVLKSLKEILDTHLSKQLSMELVEHYQPKMVITKDYEQKGFKHMEGHFISPLALHSPHLFPEEQMKMSHWRGVFPTMNSRGMTIHLAATGDHGYRWRETNVTELLKSNVGSIMVTNPFYGKRKPQAQWRSALENVSDLFILGAALAFECAYLVRWFGRDNGPIGITGMSMGGYNAGFAASNLQFPVCLVPCLSWTTAAPVYTLGTLSRAVNWKNLEVQLKSPDFRSAIGEIKNCDWLDRLHDKNVKWHHGLDSDVKRFMWILMDQFTNLEQFPVPVATNLVKFVVAEDDAYIERTGAPDIRELWPGTEVLSLKNVGHVLGIFQHGHSFRRVILEMLQRTEQFTPSTSTK
ncbi:C4orf29-like protein [Aphelenchoides besseyi]|nr:C4orf29-like protein [Aphelenchoides besseyi]KAI6225956.1 C4orf29-like protein [Aphelenchoides besseyi]